MLKGKKMKRYFPPSDIKSIFLDSPRSKSILDEVQPTSQFEEFKEWYDTQDQKTQLSFLEKLYTSVQNSKHPLILSELGIDKVIQDIKNPTTLLILSYSAQEMKQVPCKQHNARMDYRKAHFKNMGEDLEKVLEKNYEPKPKEHLFLDMPSY